MYEAMVHYGYTGKPQNVHLYGPDWNKTQYSSWKLNAAEVSDLMAKMKKEMQKCGFTYTDEVVKTSQFNPETSFAQMGFFMIYLFIDK